MNLKSPYTELKRKIVLEYLEKFKDTSTHGLARILHRDYPDFFESHEKARSMLRIYRGANGKRNRDEIKQKKYYRNVQPT